MRRDPRAISPGDYLPHAIHASDRVWVETNCSVDVWVELLHACGLDPVAGLGFTLAADFDGSQWSFVKYPIEDLRTLYDVDVAELNVWRPVVDHVEEQLGRGNLLTVEVDAFHLPDTAGVSYGTEHTKTTIVITSLDRRTGTANYLHGRGLFTVSGPDFAGLFDATGVPALPPYVELVRLAPVGAACSVPTELLLAQVRTHLERRPKDNPADRMTQALLADLGWLTGAGTETFHRWAFGTVRQFGATAELAADLAELLAARGIDVGDAAPALREAAETARSVQLMAARAARGRSVNIEAGCARFAEMWRVGIAAIEAGVASGAT